MLPYFLILLVVTRLSFLAEKTKKLKTFFYFLILIILTFFAGFRSLEVGADTSGYAHRFEALNIDFINFIKLESNIEIGYRLLEYITSLFSNNYMTILTVIALVALYFQLKSINKLSEQAVISIFIFITFGAYTFVFNGARQGIAAAIFMFALTFLVNAKFWKYILWIIIASLFHKSIIIAIPLYFIFRRKFTKTWFLLLLIGSFFAFYFFRLILNLSTFINPRYFNYVAMENQGGFYLTLCYTFLSVFFILIRSKIKSSYKINYDIYLNMFLFGTIIYIIVYLSGAYVEITRMAFYYLISSIFIWPLIFKSIKQNKSIPLFLGFVILHMSFYYIYITKIGELYPYTLNNNIL